MKFDPEAEQEDKTSHLPDKFYGKKDAIRDELADSRMKERIRKYEQGSKESLIEERSETNEKTRNETSAARTSKHKSVDAKFHISFKGTFYEIVGDQEGTKE